MEFGNNIGTIKNNTRDCSEPLHCIFVSVHSHLVLRLFVKLNHLIDPLPHHSGQLFLQVQTRKQIIYIIYICKYVFLKKVFTNKCFNAPVLKCWGLEVIVTDYFLGCWAIAHNSLYSKYFRNEVIIFTLLLTHKNKQSISDYWRRYLVWLGRRVCRGIFILNEFWKICFIFRALHEIEGKCVGIPVLLVGSRRSPAVSEHRPFQDTERWTVDHTTDQRCKQPAHGQ